MRYKKPNAGFTLLELLLYVGMSSIMLLTIVMFLSTLLESRVKNQSIIEVEQQGLLAIQLITQAIRNAEAVNSPAASTQGTSLSLDVAEPARDPTIFDVSGGVLRITEGALGPSALTNDRVAVSGLSFENLSRAGTPGIIRVSFTVSRASVSERMEYSYEKTFRVSAALRRP